MALKLGELLIREGVITQAQLDEALKCQMIFGIKLGSSLVELGYVEAEHLAHLLAGKLGVPCVEKGELEAIPREVIHSFSRDLVLKYHVVPFRLEGNRLSIAMADTTDFKAIDEIAFISGHVIKPYIAPDVQISRALARYYRISSSDIRYQQLADLRHKKKPEPVQPTTITMPTLSDKGELLNVTIPAEFEGFASLLGDQPEDPYPGQDLTRYTVDRLSLDFAAARSRDDVADVFIKYLGQEFTTCALFIIRGAAATGWRGMHDGQKIPDFGEVTILLNNPSVLRDLAESRRFAMGPLLSTPENRQILKVLGIRPEVPLLALPIIMLNKVVAAVLVSADMDSLGRRLNELQKLVKKASLAFEMLIIRNKILVT